MQNDELPSKLIKPSISTIIRVSYSNKNFKKLNKDMTTATTVVISIESLKACINEFMVG